MTGAVPGFELTRFEYEGKIRGVYRAGSGPAVIVIHEMPGLHPAVTEFGQRSWTPASPPSCPRCSAARVRRIRPGR